VQSEIRQPLPAADSGRPALAFVCPRLAEAGAVGGAETLIRRLAERAARAGGRVELLTTCARDHFTWKNEWPAGRREFDGLVVRFFPVDEDRDAAAFARAQRRIGRGEPLTAAEEAAWLAHSVPSRALCDYLRGALASFDRVLAGPYLFGLTSAVAALAPEKTLLIPCLHDEPFAYQPAIRRLFASVRGCLFNSAPERELAARLYDFPPRRGVVVGMGLEPFTADPAPLRKRLGFAAPYLLYSGRRETLKGTPLLCAYVQTFRARTGRDVRLVFTGSGAIEAPEALRPAITDLGFVSEADKHAAMAGALAFAHPSCLESFGIVLLESFLAGTPGLVHAGSPALRALCRDAGAGLWFRHYGDFETALNWLLDHEAERRALGALGAAYVRREYSWTAVERRFFERGLRL